MTAGLEAVVLAAKQLLEDSGLRVDDGTLSPATELPAVVIDGRPGQPFRTSPERGSPGGVHDIVLELVADDVRSVWWLSDQIEAALQDQVLKLPGRRFGSAKRIVAMRPTNVHQLHPGRWVTDQIYRIISIRGATP